MELVKLFQKVVQPRVAPQLVIKLDAYFNGDDDEEVTHTELDTVTGLALVLEYTDSSGKASQRLITCRSLSMRGDTLYLSAFCHVRHSLRSFRVDRISAVIEPSTGEVIDNGPSFFCEFRPDHTAKSRIHWGLHPRLRADLIALLTILIFVARCDKLYHPLEREALEAIITRFWMRLEIPSNPDIEDILAYADRIAPDGEAFWLSINRLRGSSDVLEILRPGMRDVIEADGVISGEEFYWVTQVEESLVDV